MPCEFCGENVDTNCWLYAAPNCPRYKGPTFEVVYTDRGERKAMVFAAIDRASAEKNIIYWNEERGRTEYHLGATVRRKE